MTSTASETRTTTSRNFRALDATWEAAAARAAKEGTTVSAVLNRALEAYVADGEPESVALVTVRVATRGGRVVSIDQP